VTLRRRERRAILRSGTGINPDLGILAAGAPEDGGERDLEAARKHDRLCDVMEEAVGRGAEHLICQRQATTGDDAEDRTLSGEGCTPPAIGDRHDFRTPAARSDRTQRPSQLPESAARLACCGLAPRILPPNKAPAKPCRLRLPRPVQDRGC